jgi:hypothetical protein
LDQDVQHVTVLVDSPPEVVLLPIDLEEDLIEVPFIAWARTPPP